MEKTSAFHDHLHHGGFERGQIAAGTLLHHRLNKAMHPAYPRRSAVRSPFDDLEEAQTGEVIDETEPGIFTSGFCILPQFRMVFGNYRA